MFDKDGDGTISIREIQIMFARLGSKYTKEQVEELIEEFDDDKSGELEFDEFL